MPKKLRPCPFCDYKRPTLERAGTPRHSCIVICGNCGARHESSDEGEACGTSWNNRADDLPANVVPLRVNRQDLSRLVNDIKRAVYSFSGGVSVTEAIGALELAKLEIFNEQLR